MTYREYHRHSRALGFGFREEFIIIFLLIAAVFFEGIGITMFLPIVEFIQRGHQLDQLASESRLWRSIIAIYGTFGIPVNLPTLITASFLCILIRQIFSYARQVYMAKVQFMTEERVRNKIFRLYLNVESGYLDEEKPGALVNSSTTELSLALQSVLAPLKLFAQVFLAVFYIVLLLALTGPITVIAIFVLGITAYFLKKLLIKTSGVGVDVATANEAFAAYLVERLDFVRLIRISANEKYEINGMENITAFQRNRLIKINRFLAQVNVLMEPIGLAVGMAVLYFGTTYFELRLEEVIVFAFIAIVRLLPTAKEMMATGQLTLAYQPSLFSLVSKLDALFKAREIRDGVLPFTSLTHAIQFQDVSFTYPSRKNKKALTNLDIVFPACKMTALVGPSGAGKSTIIDLLPRLREPTSGEISFDDQNIDQLEITSLRNSIAYLSQTTLVLNTSITDHIRYGNVKASDEEVREAAALAQAHDFIEALPEKYNTILGQRGIKLSGGQRQRLDLARVLLQKAPILILDEPTSNLDAESEMLFRRALMTIRKQHSTTIIIVAHRLSTILDADQIVVLLDGQVDAVGTHDEVSESSDWYRSAFNTQSISDTKYSTSNFLANP
ncbi:MAG: hypothetical protein CMM76_13920 [Rhodospirillaceae bacterium]|nr:hypothetical protein [Rhodospirillaceae bacterium]